jgi:two-component system chemotaxis sensor kinase CheA
MQEHDQGTPSELWVAGWAERIDALATRLMVDGEAPDLGDALGQLEREAREYGQTSAMAAATRLKSMHSEPGAAATLLSSGLAELRSSLIAEEQIAPMPSALSEDAELVGDFLVEAREHLSQIEGQMLILEREPQSMEVIHAVFRAFHTIKGLAGFLDFKGVQAIAHEVETLLDLARNEKLTIHSAIVDIVLESGDFLQAELASIERTLESGEALMLQDTDALAPRIRALAIADSTPVPSLWDEPDVTQSQPSPTGFEATLVFGSELAEKQATTEISSIPTPADSALYTGTISPDLRQAIEPAAGAALAATAIESNPGLLDSSSDVTTSRDEQTGQAARPDKPSDRPTKSVEAASTSPANREATPRSADSGSVRVETAKLDHLMNMVGEIVIAQSLIRHNPMLGANSDSRLLGDLSQLARVTAEVQRATMSMRMIPVGQLFQRIERVIRDLSRKAGKQVVLETFGVETEIDKTVAEELSDPLLHMVRNSVDHGIELPADRTIAGKPIPAKIRLSAHHQGSQIVIQIEDDGRGLNAERIRRKAEERGLISPGANLADAEIYQLIFEPGFSTAEKITDVSGRGVGMDVVRRNVEKLQGRIETFSSAGQGTSFQLKLPLTLAIIDGLVVEVGGENFIIALSAVREIFHPKPETVFTVEGRNELVLVREQLMPVIRLHRRLEMPPRLKAPSDGLLVVVESEGKRFCLHVDDLIGKQEVVIKSLGEMFSEVAGFSGCAVLGDGRVGLILDVDGVCRGKRA